MTNTTAELLAALRPLLDRAFELTLSERDAWLAQLRLGEPVLAMELEKLLAAEAGLDDQGFLSDHALGNVAESEAGLAGLRLGAYTLERPLGQGGMGTVWLARRSDGRFEGTAAVKLLNLALLDRVGVERFRREGTVLARLNHPHIARLLDAGVTDVGQPYLVLEYVGGERIDHYCAAHRLPRDQRIALFLDVLGAVALAHASLIVHRDLKPSNILVTADGVVKLLDFGIAKLLDAEGADAERTGLTEAGGSPLTPEYAAPEQVTGGTITTATDIYALGVVLYLLLAGVHPTAAPGSGPAERVRGLLETDPPLLSSILSRAAASTAKPRGLQQLFAGDLDLIVAKALRKEPAERYATVAAVADDLGRFLRDEPVLARPATFRYRATKFLRRYRRWVGAGAAAAAVLITLTVVAVLQANDARHQRQEAVRQRDDAVAQRDRAVYEEQRASASSDFMNSVLQSIAPGGGAFTTLQLLDRGRELLESDSSEDPRFAARMMVEFADHYSDLAQFQREEALLEHAEQLATQQGDFETAAHAGCRLGESFLNFGFRERGRASFDRARRALAQVPLPRPEVRISCYSAEAGVAGFEKQPDTAIALGRVVLALLDSAGDTASLRYTRNVGNLAGHLSIVGRVRESLALQQRKVQVLTRLGLGRTVSMADALLDLADFHARLGEYRTADSLLTLARQLSRGINRSGPAPVVDLLLWGAEYAHELGFQDLAKADYLRGLAMAHRIKDSWGEEWAYRGLLEMALDQGRPREAERYLAEAGDLLPPSPRARLRARLLAVEGKPRIAQRRMREALVASGFPDLPLYVQHVPRMVAAAATIALEAGDAVEADSFARHAVRIARERGHRETESAELGSALVVLARARLALGDSAGARDALGRALPGLRNGLGAGHKRVLAAEAVLRALKVEVGAESSPPR